MDIQIIKLHVKGVNKLEICRLLDLKFDYVSEVVADFLINPYIIRESKNESVNRLIRWTIM